MAKITNCTDVLGFEIDEKAGTVTIVMPLYTEPVLSASGKTLRVCSTGPAQTVAAKYKGKPVSVGLNAYIRA